MKTSPDSQTTPYNPYYLAYCKANSKRPHEMLAHDKKEWEGACMTGFMIWMRDRWNDWRLSVERRDLEKLTEEEISAFDSYLGEA